MKELDDVIKQINKMIAAVELTTDLTEPKNTMISVPQISYHFLKNKLNDYENRKSNCQHSGVEIKSQSVSWDLGTR